MRNKLVNWKSALPKLPDPKNRPNDFQRLVLHCLSNGMTVRDATRVFGLTEKTVRAWRDGFSGVNANNDIEYFMHRAKLLGADMETLGQWFAG